MLENNVFKNEILIDGFNLVQQNAYIMLPVTNKLIKTIGYASQVLFGDEQHASEAFDGNAGPQQP